MADCGCKALVKSTTADHWLVCATCADEVCRSCHVCKSLFYNTYDLLKRCTICACYYCEECQFESRPDECCKACFQ
jgi:hypothetical protein